MSQTRELDLRSLPPAMRHGVVFQCFDALVTGEAMIIVNDHDPMPLLQQFRFARPGEAEHEYVERGPEVWQVRIARRSPRPVAPPPATAAPGRAAEGDGPGSATEYLEADHRRLDAILPDVGRLAAAGAYPDAATRFSEFATGLDRHIELEEQILFPTFEGATGMVGGPTDVMRAEHVELREWLRVAADSLAERDAELLAGALDGLTRTLSIHNVKEERMLYPMTDEAMGDPEGRRRLVARLQSF